MKLAKSQLLKIIQEEMVAVKGGLGSMRLDQIQDDLRYKLEDLLARADAGQYYTIGKNELDVLANLWLTIKRETPRDLDEAHWGAGGEFPGRYGDAHEKRRQRRQVTPDELEEFLDTYVVDNPLYIDRTADGETSKDLFRGYAESMGMPSSVEALQDMYDSLARTINPYDRSHMADLEGGY